MTEPSGDLTPCCWTSKESDRVGKVEPGRTSVADVWNGEVHQGIRETYNNGGSEKLDKSANLCARCYGPGLFKHALSELDFLIFDQFSQLYGRADPALSRAFELLLGPMDDTGRKW